MATEVRMKRLTTKKKTELIKAVTEILGRAQTEIENEYIRDGEYSFGDIQITGHRPRIVHYPKERRNGLTRWVEVDIKYSFRLKDNETWE